MKVSRGAMSVCVSSLILGCAPAVTADGSSSPLGGLETVVAFGDSITRGYGVSQGKGWVELLAGMKKKSGGKHIQVFNAGGNGNTSGEGLARIEADVLSHMPGLVLVEFGGNDARHSAGGLSVDEFERNMETIRKLVESKGGKIALITFPPIIDEWHAWKNDPYYVKQGGLDHCVEQYRQRTRELAARFACPLLDLDKLLREQMKKKGRERIVSKDGVHLTAEANQIVAEAVASFICGKSAGK